MAPYVNMGALRMPFQQVARFLLLSLFFFLPFEQNREGAGAAPAPPTRAEAKRPLSQGGHL